MSKCDLTKYVLKGIFSDLVIPERVHVPGAHGGHLTIIPKNHVAGKQDLRDDQILEMNTMSRLARTILRYCFRASACEELARDSNTIGHPLEPLTTHINIYGRSDGHKIDLEKIDTDPEFKGYPYNPIQFWDIKAAARQLVFDENAAPESIKRYSRHLLSEVQHMAGMDIPRYG